MTGNQDCQLRVDDIPCGGPAEVQVSDETEERYWGCIKHAAAVLKLVTTAGVVAGTRPGVMLDAYCAAFPDQYREAAQ